jgi:peptidoglycan/xylan/chitin deacetylase (PgdA/CDA1 family)
LAHLLKRVLAYALYYLGLLHLWQRLTLRNRAVVLMYHRVLTHEQWRNSGSHPGIVVTPDTFARHLAVLKRRFVVLTLSQFADRLERGVPFDNSSCLITFDDGWHDNLTNALPLLTQYQLPAVIFLPVNYIGTRRYFWREALTHLLLQAIQRSGEQSEAPSRFAEILDPIGLSDLLAPGAPATADRVIERVSAVALTRQEAERLVDLLSSALGLNVSQMVTSDRFLDWADVDVLAAHGVSFGGHGAEHLRLAEVPPEVAREDIALSHRVLNGVFARTVPSFSYPNGTWNATVVEQVRSAGYRLAFTTRPGVIAAQDDRFTLKRVNIHEAATLTPPLFMARVLGLF